MDTFSVTIEKPATGEIDTVRFDVWDYSEEYESYREAQSAMRVDVATYCNESMQLGWDVLALDGDGRVVFRYEDE